MDDEKIKEHLQNAKTIAVIGFSKDPIKTAYRIPKYLTDYYKVIPVNPTVEKIDDVTCFKSIKDVPEPVDIINVFRPGPDCGEIMEQIVELKSKPKLVWLQLGITNEKARNLAQEHNIDYIEDECIKVVHKRILT